MKDFCRDFSSTKMCVQDEGEGGKESDGNSIGPDTGTAERFEIG